MTSTPMDIDESPLTNAIPSLNITRTIPTTAAVSDVISIYRPTKLFQRDDVKEGKTKPQILSIDFDDPGEFCMTSESDETIQIYNVKDGRHDKTLLSKKYGVKLARFTHANSSIIYASTKQNHAIRYLSTHDNSFLRYFEGHEGDVTDLAMHPGHDIFLSCGRDNKMFLWDMRTKNWNGRFNLHTPSLSAWDPSGNVFAVACPGSATVLLYDHGNWTKAPFGNFDILKAAGNIHPEACFEGWTKLAFSNDGKHLLLGSKYGGHFLLDAFDGSLKAYLKKPNGGTKRMGAGDPEGSGVVSSGNCCFTPDGRYVISGCKNDLLIWDTLVTPDEKSMLEPAHILEEKREAEVVAHNPRFNMLATADNDLMFWLPDPHA